MKKNHAFIPCFLIITLSSALIFFITAFTQNIPSKTLLSRLAANSYQPHYNSFSNNNHFIYLIMQLSITIVYMLKILVWRRQQALTLPSLLSGVLTGTLLITMALQTIGQTYYFIHKFQSVGGKKAVDRYPGALKGTVDFAGFCKQRLPGSHNCELISDLDTYRDPGMFLHRTLAYHLYPIDIRDIRSAPSDCVIVFATADALSRVPKGYGVVGTWGPENLLAIKDIAHP